MDTPRYEYEQSALGFKLFLRPQLFEIRDSIFRMVKENLFGQDMFFVDFLLKPVIYFGIFFLHHRFISETYF
jgi:hypothetical protein